MKSNKNPKVEVLQRGVWLATIAYAVGYFFHPELNNELSWDGPNYSRQDTSGSRGTITFSEEGLVGVFRDENSDRLSSFNKNRLGYTLEQFLDGMPENLRNLANHEALQYLLEEYQGKVQPIITAAFWSDGQNRESFILDAAEDWTQVDGHGAHLIYRELMDIEEAIGAWQKYFDFSEEQINFVKFILYKKLANPYKPILLKRKELIRFSEKHSTGQDLAIDNLRKIGFKVV